MFLNLCETAARQILFFIKRGFGPNKLARKYLPNFFLISYINLLEPEFYI